MAARVPKGGDVHSNHGDDDKSGLRLGFKGDRIGFNGVRHGFKRDGSDREVVHGSLASKELNVAGGSKHVGVGASRSVRESGASKAGEDHTLAGVAEVGMGEPVQGAARVLLRNLSRDAKVGSHATSSGVAARVFLHPNGSTGAASNPSAILIGGKKISLVSNEPGADLVSSAKQSGDVLEAAGAGAAVLPFVVVQPSNTTMVFGSMETTDSGYAGGVDGESLFSRVNDRERQHEV